MLMSKGMRRCQLYRLFCAKPNWEHSETIFPTKSLSLLCSSFPTPISFILLDKLLSYRGPIINMASAHLNPRLTPLTGSHPRKSSTSQPGRVRGRGGYQKKRNIWSANELFRKTIRDTRLNGKAPIPIPENRGRLPGSPSAMLMPPSSRTGNRIENGWWIAFSEVWIPFLECHSLRNLESG